jgi:hypothetical protein
MKRCWQRDSDDWLAPYINAGPGGPQKGQVAISHESQHAGANGNGDAYLANPLVVAATASAISAVQTYKK